MKIGIIVDAGDRKEKECLSIAHNIEGILEREGYKVIITWPDLVDLVERVQKVREAIREIV